MDIAVVTDPTGLVGGEVVRALGPRYDLLVGLDATAGPTTPAEPTARFRHHRVDLADRAAVSTVLAEYGSDVRLVVHTGREPEGQDPMLIAVGTSNLLHAVHARCPDAVFVLNSGVEVYGTAPNLLPLVETATRWDLPEDHPAHDRGLPEARHVDHVERTPRGTALLAADLAAQDSGKRLDVAVGVFRTAGLVATTGESPFAQHGFVSALVRDALRGSPFVVRGFGGKQVRDVLDVADLVEMFWQFAMAPRPGEVYHAGGGRERSCSLLEAIAGYEHLTDHQVAFDYDPEPRYADVRYWSTDTAKFRAHYPRWRPTTALPDLVAAAHRHWSARLERLPGEVV
ncbi:NAD-dependent epimerase/dehydratase family protein [Actinosynnema pretiosum subsp. pretiosum]|uniref:NAD-dependent epimerase/dehydratase family protein n=1 Tax=Actinosynnema pretiosum subsp. pretiosum TaxID=103721 RepID=A0AA45R5B7_9PSEU|nr:NAD-dependent epimerase/dehydratase [Actinosynnema pretiosum subsp. pretiosum]QUF05508.1 NAD-dependent epimerase/dehydratase family protein [Actinosynnema pretiosum subsp. pretiosum]